MPPAVYVGHPGWKAAGGGISYSLATGVAIFLLCVFGLFPLLNAILPIPAIVPVLLYIGLVIGAQAFRAVPRAHYPAIVLAVVPNVGDQPRRRRVDDGEDERRRRGQRGAEQRRRHLRGAAQARGGSGACRDGARRDRGVHDRPALLVGTGYSFLGGCLALIGLIHGAKVTLDISNVHFKIALGYFFMAAVCGVFAYMKIPEREVDPNDPADVEEAAERFAAGLPKGVDAEPKAKPVPA